MIEFGWDHPNVDQLSRNLPQMQNSPFDGICFSIHEYMLNAFDTELYTDARLKINQLASLKWGKYTDNYLIMRGDGTAAGKWFDETAWKSVKANLRMVSRALAVGRIKGIMFDAEYYRNDPRSNPWTYTKTQYPMLSFNQVRAKVKQRGSEFIQALQESKTDLSFLSIWLTSLVADEKKLKIPLQTSRHALLPAFFEGIFEAKHDSVVIYDGNEFGYWYSKPSQFIESADNLRAHLIELMQTPKAKLEASKVRIAQPIYYDNLLATDSRFNYGIPYKGKLKWLEENTKLAVASSDGLTWFYSEHLNWWKGNTHDTLTKILIDNKAALASNIRSTATTIADKVGIKVANINSGVAKYYYNRKGSPMETGENAFRYSFDRLSKKLIIQFTGEIPKTFSVYVNNKLYRTLNPSSSKESLLVGSFTNGRMTLLAKYNDDSEASAVEVFGTL